MKVKVGIIRKQYYCGEVEMTEEKFKEYKEMDEKHIIECMLLKKAVNHTEDKYFLDCFQR